MSIAHRPGGAAHYSDPERWCWIAGVCRRLRLGLRRYSKRHYGCQSNTGDESPSRNLRDPSIRIYEPQYCAKVDVSQERTSQGREFHFGKSLGLPFVHLGSHSRAKKGNQGLASCSEGPVKGRQLEDRAQSEESHLTRSESYDTRERCVTLPRTVFRPANREGAKTSSE